MLASVPPSAFGLIFVITGLTFGGICVTRFWRALRTGTDTMVRPIDELAPASWVFIIGATLFAAAAVIHRGGGILDSVPMVVACALPFVLADWGVRKSSAGARHLTRRILTADVSVAALIVLLVGYLHQSP